MKEMWKEAKGLQGYEASTLGRIRSIKRTVKHKNGAVCEYKGRILKQSKTRNGYLRIYPSIKGVRKISSVHRIVLSTFIDNPENKPQVNHIDGDKSNNNLINLEWSTQSENQKHAFSTGLNSNRGNRSATATINDDIAKVIKTGLKIDRPCNVARFLDISYHIIKDINRNKTWTHVKV